MPQKINNEIIFLPSLQIVSRVVGKKTKPHTEKKASIKSAKEDISSATHGPLKVGAKVIFPLSNKTSAGILRFIGPTKFSSGTWCGIELSKPEGRNNGTVKGVKYFQCKFNYGIFVHAEKVSLASEGEIETAKGSGKPGILPHDQIKRKSRSEDVKAEELRVRQINTTVDDEWVVFSEEEDHSSTEKTNDSKKSTKKAPKHEKSHKSSQIGDELAKDASKALTDVKINESGDQSDVIDTADNMKTVLAGEVDVENSPLTIKIVKSVSEDNNNNNLENGAKTEFKDGLLFYVTAHTSSSLGPKEKHKSCPVLSTSSEDEGYDIEGQSNSWPKYPKDEIKLKKDHEHQEANKSNLRRRLSGIEKRIRLSHFRPSSPGTLRRSLSHSAVYPKENYVAYEEHSYRSPGFISLKRSCSDVTAYSTRLQSNGSSKPSIVSKRPHFRRERTAPSSLQSSEANETEESEKSDGEEELKTDVMISLAKYDSTDNFTNVVVGETDKELENEISEPRENGQALDESFAIVEEEIVCADETTVEAEMVAFDKSASSDEPFVDKSNDNKHGISTEAEKNRNLPSNEDKRKTSLNKKIQSGLRKSSSGEPGSGLPVFAKTTVSKYHTQTKSQIPSKAARKLSVPLPATKKDTSKTLKPMLNRECRSQLDLSIKKQDSIDDKVKLPKKLNKRVSDLVANFEKTNDGPTQKKEETSGVTVRVSVSKTKPDDKRSVTTIKSATKIQESAAAKETRRNSSSATPRKSSQVSQEELAGKAALSQQYLKEEQNKKPCQTTKASSGSVVTPKTNASTASRSGIPGYGKRSQKQQTGKDNKDGNDRSIETPKKSNFSFKFSSSKPDKTSPSQRSTSSTEKERHSSSSDSPSTAHNDKVQIQELKTKCRDCEHQIRSLKAGMKQKNLAMEAFIIVIKQHIRTIEEQSSKQVQDHQRNNELAKQLMIQTELTVANEEKFNELDERFATLSTDYSKQIENLKIVHAREVQSLKTELKEVHEKEMGQANAKFNKEIAKLKEQHEAELSELHEEHTIILGTLKEEHELTVQGRDDDFFKAKEGLETQYQTEKEEICLDYEERLQDLKAQLNVSQQKCNEFEYKSKELQEELEKDVEAKVQGALAKYKNLPAELESLQAVVEMKNEDIRKARTHNMELQKKLEDFYELEKKYTKLLQEKEALDAALQNKVKCERQLSVERESLQANLEKEARKVKRLSMEKEELMWKFSNSSSLSLSSPSLNVDLPGSPNGLQSTPNSSRSFSRSLKTQSLYLPPLDDEDYTVL